MADKGSIVSKRFIARKGFYSKEEKEKRKRHPNCFFHVHCRPSPSDCRISGQRLHSLSWRTGLIDSVNETLMCQTAPSGSGSAGLASSGNRVRMYSLALSVGSFTVPGPLRTKKSPPGYPRTRPRHGSPLCRAATEAGRFFFFSVMRSRPGTAASRASPGRCARNGPVP